MESETAKRRVRLATTVLLLRHGETALNRSGALRGQIDVSLSDNGRREANQLAARVASAYPVTAVFSSGLSRVSEAIAEASTTQAIARLLVGACGAHATRVTARPRQG